MGDIPNEFETEPARPPSPGELAQTRASYIEDLARTVGLHLNHDALAVIVGDVTTWWRLRLWMKKNQAR